MLAEGTPLWVVSEVLGHGSVAVTKDIYGHVMGSEKQEATEAITDALFEAGSGATASVHPTDRAGSPTPTRRGAQIG